MKEYLHAKIHNAYVTEANKHYIGSISICPELLQQTGLEINQKVLVSNNTNGNRLETYIIPGKKGEICLNGAAAHHFKKGDQCIIMGFIFAQKPPTPRIILVDQNNNFIKYLNA